MGYDNNVYVQVGNIMLIGLAAKNAILIVEFAKAKHDEGMSPQDAALESARLRFRPILMTAFAFILGVVPLMLASGAGAGAQNVMGTAVFWGMLVATVSRSVPDSRQLRVCRRLGKKKKPVAGRGSRGANQPRERIDMTRDVFLLPSLESSRRLRKFSAGFSHRGSIRETPTLATKTHEGHEGVRNIYTLRLRAFRSPWW